MCFIRTSLKSSLFFLLLLFYWIFMNKRQRDENWVYERKEFFNNPRKKDQSIYADKVRKRAHVQPTTKESFKHEYIWIEGNCELCGKLIQSKWTLLAVSLMIHKIHIYFSHSLSYLACTLTYVMWLLRMRWWKWWRFFLPFFHAATIEWTKGLIKISLRFFVVKFQVEK